MTRRSEKRPVRVEKDLEVEIVKCDQCGTEITTSRDVYFGEDRLVVEGEDVPWFILHVRKGSAWMPSGSNGIDLCSRVCLSAFTSGEKVDDLMRSVEVPATS